MYNKSSVMNHQSLMFYVLPGKDIPLGPGCVNYVLLPLVPTAMACLVGVLPIENLTVQCSARLLLLWRYLIGSEPNPNQLSFL